MKNIRDVVAHLIAYGWTIFKIQEIAPHIDPVLRDFKRLLAEPDEYKAKWKIHIPELSDKADHGLLPPKGSGYDQKWMLMWRRNLRAMLLDGRLTYDEIERYRELFVNLNSLFNIGYKTILKVAAEFDRQMPGYYLYQHINKQSLMETHSLRLPEYLYDAAAPDRLYSAQPHGDLGVLTVQLFDTFRGLILEGYDSELVDYNCNREEGTVVIFVGDKMEQLTFGRLPAVRHGVLALAKENRNSLMFFGHTEHPSRERDGQHVPFEEAKVRKLMKKMMAVAY